jgi:hypothetical protein
MTTIFLSSSKGLVLELAVAIVAIKHNIRIPNIDIRKK